MGEFDLLAELTARLASAERLDEVVDTVLHTIVKLDFDSVWVAVLDEDTGNLATVAEIIEGVDTTHEAPMMRALDPRQPIGVSFRERRMISIADPDSLYVIEGDDEPPPNKLGLLRVPHEHMRGHPFACGPLLGSRGQPVGALGLSSYRGNQPIPDALLSQGLVRAFIDHLGIALERALQRGKLDAILARTQAAMIRDARLKAVGELAATVAHDLNNLSGIALLAVGVGLRSPADAVDMLPRIERANRAIGKHVARLQRIARSPSNDTETTDLRQIVDDILMMMAPTLREQSIEVDSDADRSEMPLVRCDVVVVHQVVLNLLINAKDALGQVPPERRRIEIRLHDDGGMVRLIVADSGPGIAPEVLEQLFQRIYTTKDSSHQGLAMASAYTALKQFGGQIAARNARNGGAVFEVTLVAAPASTPASPPLPPPPPASTEPTRRGRILAVDDDPDIVDVIRAHLESIGYEVVTATDPAQAIDAATSQVFDLVLCDLGMPKHSGLDVCRSLREADYRGKLVLMTGWDTETLRTEHRECDMLLKKPFEGADLVHTIDTLLGR